MYLKQSVGIDCSKDSFHACMCRIDTDQTLSFTTVQRFQNTKIGFNQLLKWVRKTAEKEVPVCFVMEATGVYYESLAYHLHKAGKVVSVELANKVKHFIQSLNIKTKTDSADACAIAQFGAERRLNAWQPPAPVFLQMRQLTRYYEQLQQQKVGLKNMLHSKEFSYGVDALVLQSNRSLIKSIERQIDKTVKALQELIDKHSWLSDKFKKLQSIKGVSLISAAIIVAETQGFKLIKNRKQLTSYAGYDVVERQSGTSVFGKTRISKKGNKHIRRALHFPALAASRYDDRHKIIYNTINEKRDNKVKMIGVVALQRRLLLLMYAMWKNDTTYDPAYQSQNK